MEKIQGAPGQPPPYPGPSEDLRAPTYVELQPNSPPYPVPQPAYQYSPQQPQVLQPGQQPAVIQPVNPVIVMQQLPADVPGQMMCPHCQTNVVTTIKYSVGMLTWVICGVLGVLICWPCCLIPFCVKDCKDVVHSCPTCHAVLHIHKRI